ncbi:hypothetical protein AB4Z35_08685 [Pseudomonas sp. KB_15]|uniref:hypothetical protein n=1 Tax=Pseudomonas sp. KB_15 TaxID=3233035 RepID=UPI003F9E2FB4
MEVMRSIAIISCVLSAAWLAALFVGVCCQLLQIRRNWINDSADPIQNNPVLDRALDFFALNYGDRFTHSLLIISAILAWPVSLILFFPVLSTLRAKERVRHKKAQLGNTDSTQFLADESAAAQTSVTEIHQPINS